MIGHRCSNFCDSIIVVMVMLMNSDLCSYIIFAIETLLAESWLTPLDLMFVRNHHPVPVVSDPNNFTLTIHIPLSRTESDPQKCSSRTDAYAGTNIVEGTEIDENKAAFRTVSYTVADLKRLFVPRTIVASVQCGGNRRHEMNEVSW